MRKWLGKWMCKVSGYHRMDYYSNKCKRCGHTRTAAKKVA